jgi:hypothetical protein
LGGVVGEGGFVGRGVEVGKSASVAVASGEQAASPLTTPTAPIFKASLRDIFLILVMGIPLKSIFTKGVGGSMLYGFYTRIRLIPCEREIKTLLIRTRFQREI